jgi:hypothetical protein
MAKRSVVGAAEFTRAYPNVLRGLGLATALMMPSCFMLMCSRMDIGLSFGREYEPIVVDRKVGPDGTEFCVTQVLNPGGEPYTTWFNVRRPGSPWKRYFLGNDEFWIGQIELRPEEKTAVVHSPDSEIVFDWTHGYSLPHYEHVIGLGPEPRDVADPYARERHE